MRNLLPLLVILLLVLGGLGASAIQNSNQNSNIEMFESQSTKLARDYTHTVLVEVGTATWCSACPASNSAWHNIYGSGDYDFEYVELVSDKNSKASSRFAQFNPKYYPTSYWDGGEFAYPGTNSFRFKDYLDVAGSRDVPDLQASLELTWLGSSEIEIFYIVENNDNGDYPGRLRIYVLELESTLWNDYSGKPYYHALLDFPVNKNIDIDAGGAISDTIVWDGDSAGYPDITEDNVQVILAVFDDEPHQSYSDPPNGNPFQAYYSDECVAATFGEEPNNPPTTPSIDGPTNGDVGTTYDYTVSATDPEGDDVYYWIEWCADGCNTDWEGPFPSGEEQVFSHAWDHGGTHTVKVKAKDTNDAESEWETFDVTIPRSRTLNTQFHLFFSRFPYAFLIMKHLFGLL